MGAWLFQRGFFTLGTAYIISYYSGMLTHPISRITRQLEDLQRASAGIGRIQELLAVRSRIADSPSTAVQMTAGPYSVSFVGVSFGYDDIVSEEALHQPDVDRNDANMLKAVTDKDEEETAEKQIVLHDLNLHIKPGRILGLLGRTGSGKTTLTRLIFRLYDPDKGEVLLGQDHGKGVNIRELPLQKLRQNIGMVTQNIQLFNATVRDNLTFFDNTINDEDILQVIEDLKLGAWFHTLPFGLDTELESGGSGLSAGEQQLLAFTRIFLQDPGVVILDEASSRLDPATEHLIERAVDRLIQHRTAIIIAHRLSTVQRADEILILEDGRIQEYGSREELAGDPNSRFYHLLQTGLEEVLV
jgi:ATP-binding cassette subfamily B protein